MGLEAAQFGASQLAPLTGLGADRLELPQEGQGLGPPAAEAQPLAAHELQATLGRGDQLRGLGQGQGPGCRGKGRGGLRRQRRGPCGLRSDPSGLTVRQGRQIAHWQSRPIDQYQGGPQARA